MTDLRPLVLEAVRVLDELPRLPAGERRAAREALRGKLSAAVDERGGVPDPAGTYHDHVEHARQVAPLVQELTDAGHPVIDPAAAVEQAMMTVSDRDGCCSMVAPATPLDVALSYAFTQAELAELAHGLAEVPNLIRGAGSLAVRPLTIAGGPLERLAAAAAAASGHAAPPATTRGTVPLAPNRVVAP